jgi:hypothetical protein
MYAIPLWVSGVCSGHVRHAGEQTAAQDAWNESLDGQAMRRVRSVDLRNGCGFRQLRVDTYASGFWMPLELVQDPSTPSVQYVGSRPGRWVIRTATCYPRRF